MTTNDEQYVPSEYEMRHAYWLTRMLDHHAAVDAAFDRFLARVRRDASVVEAMLTAALTPEPERPDGAEEIEAVLREEWTFSDEDGGGDAFGDLAQRLASRGVRVVGEEDPR